MSDFIIPNTGRKKNENIQILEAGPNPGILYAIVDEGTHYNKWFDKTSRTLRLIFEFPLLKQLFMEGDTELKPTVVSQEYTFVLAEKSNLKKIIDGAEGRILKPSEYKNGWNIGQYLGRTFIVDIVNKQNKQDPEIYHNNIVGVKALTDSMKAKYNFDWEQVTRTNDLVSFMIDPEGASFNSETYTKLPPYLRRKTRESEEGREYEANGGVFAEKEKTNGNGNGNAPKPKAPAPASTPDNIKMLKTEFSYESYKSQGWTDEQLVKEGIIEIIKAPEGPSNPPKLGDDGVPF